MNIRHSGLQTLAFRLALAALLVSVCSVSGTAQVSPNEILNPQLKALESQYFSQLKNMNQQIAKARFPFPFYLSRTVGSGYAGTGIQAVQGPCPAEGHRELQCRL